MLASLIIITLVTVGGTFLTYLYENDETLLPRVCMGNVIGSAIFGFVCFLLACGFGLSIPVISAAVALTLLPALLLTRADIYGNFILNLRKARGKFEGANFRKFTVFTYYTSIFLILCVFFDRAMFENKDGIFTGGSNNLGDLPFHLGAIFSFTDGHNFPPENPSFAGAKFTYPFIADFIVAGMMKFGSRVQDAMFVQNVTLGFSLVVLLERFAFRLTNNRLAGKIAPVLLLFCGGLGFLVFFRDYWQDGRGIFEFIRHLDKDYTIRSETLRWGNSLIVLFLTQRAFLLGMPIVLIVLTWAWRIFSANNDTDLGEAGERKSRKTFSIREHLNWSPFLVGLIAGLLPLIHVHSLFALFIVFAFLFFLRFDKWLVWITFGVGVSITAVPELVWSLTGSATDLGKFIGWHFGWDKGDDNFFVFWAVNLGLFIPLLLAALFLTVYRKDTGDRRSTVRLTSLDIHPLLLFYMPFAFIFVLSNVVKLAPWQWDNIKVLIYWYVGSLPLVAWLLADLWDRKTFFKVISLSSILILTLSGGLDVWRVLSGQINYRVFDHDSVAAAEELKPIVPPNALFLNAPTYNSTVVLTGRRSLMRYVGHLSSYGIDYESREKELQRIYEGSALAEGFLQKNNIEYVVISPEERTYMSQNRLVLNEEFFEKYPKIVDAGNYKIYKVR